MNNYLQIDSKTATVVMASLYYFCERKVDSVTISINSSDGATPLGAFAIYDAMQWAINEKKLKVKTQCQGEASGYASLLLTAGSPLERTARPDSRISIQEAKTDLPTDMVDTHTYSHSHTHLQCKCKSYHLIHNNP